MKDIEQMDLLPRWAYIDSEWNTIVEQTVCIIDGIRYKNKEPEQIRLEEIDAFASMLL